MQTPTPPTHHCECGRKAASLRSGYWVCERCGDLETKSRKHPARRTMEVRYSTDFYKVTVPGYAC